MSAQAYLNLIERIDGGCYYLWGPIQNALMLELEQSNQDLIFAIFAEGTLTDDHHIPATRRDMLVQVLTTFAIDQRGTVHDLLRRLLDYPTLYPQAHRANERRWIEVHRIVAQIAGALQFVDILEQLLQSKSVALRRTAVRAAIVLWASNHSLGADLLTRLGHRAIRRWRLPSKRLVTVCFEFSVNVLVNHFSDGVTVGLLLTFWKDMIRRFLGKGNPEPGHLLSAFRSFAVRMSRQVVLILGVNVIILLATYFADEDKTSGISFPEARCFFKRRNKDVRERFTKLAPYLDALHTNFVDVKTDLEAMALDPDMISHLLLIGILASHLQYRADDVFDFVQHLLDLVFSKTPSSLVIPYLNVSISSYLDGLTADEIKPEYLQIQESLIVRYYQMSKSVGIGQTGARSVYSGLSSYPHYYYRKYQSVNPDIITLFEADFEVNNQINREAILLYLENIVTAPYPKYRDLEPILLYLKPLLKRIVTSAGKGTGQPPDEWLLTRVIDRLAQLRAYAPDKVDMFMSREGLSAVIQERVRNRSGEDIFTPKLGIGVALFIRDILVHPGSLVWKIMMTWFANAPIYRTLNQWFRALVPLVINELMGEPLFKQDEKLAAYRRQLDMVQYAKDTAEAPR